MYRSLLVRVKAPLTFIFRIGLMEKGKTEQARKSLCWLRPDQDGVDTELINIQAAIDEAKVRAVPPLPFGYRHGKALLTSLALSM